MKQTVIDCSKANKHEQMGPEDSLIRIEFMSSSMRRCVGDALLNASRQYATLVAML